MMMMSVTATYHHYYVIFNFKKKTNVLISRTNPTFLFSLSNTRPGANDGVLL